MSFSDLSYALMLAMIVWLALQIDDGDGGKRSRMPIG